MKKSQFITIFVLMIVATVLIVVGCFTGKDPKDISKKEVVVNTTLKPMETEAPETGAPSEATATPEMTNDPDVTPTPEQSPTPAIVEFPVIRNADFIQYSNDFDNFSTAWKDKTATEQATGYISSGTLERLKGINYVYYTNVDSTESWDVFVTFSMHYEYGQTIKTLDLLKDKGVKAVFFVSAQYIKENPDIVRRIVADGHILGNRPVIDENEVSTLTPEQFANKLLETETEYQKLFGPTERMYLYRTDYFSNRQLRIAEALGYTVVFRTYTYYQTEGAYGKAKVKDATFLAARFNERGLYKGSVDEFVCEPECYNALGAFLQHGIDENVSFKLVERKIF